MAKPLSSLKRLTKDYFTFTRWQRRTLSLLIPAIVISIAGWKYWFQQQLHSGPMPDASLLVQVAEDLKAADSINERLASNREASFADYRQPGQENFALFFFDPNTADSTTLSKLGFRERTIKTLLNYRAKGGRFQQPQDLAKLYGLRPKEAAKLMPYVRIDATVEITKRDTLKAFGGLPATPKNNSNSWIDINYSDTTAWKALPGIGSKLAARIVNFRDKLGGFYSTAQVAETFALPDSTYQKILPRLRKAEYSLNQIRINSYTAAELEVHPYISRSLARVLEQYRSQHGPYKNIDDLRRINIIDEAWIEKILPYLSFE